MQRYMHQHVVLHPRAVREKRRSVRRIVIRNDAVCHRCHCERVRLHLEVRVRRPEPLIIAFLNVLSERLAEKLPPRIAQGVDRDAAERAAEVVAQEPMAAQMVADLAEADGYEVNFGGGGIAYDELLGAVQEQQPDVLLMFSSCAADAPDIRRLIDTIRAIGACPNTQIAVGGGVFARAEGLAEEIGADLWSHSPAEMIAQMNAQPERRATPEQRTVGQNRAAA